MDEEDWLKICGFIIFLSILMLIVDFSPITLTIGGILIIAFIIWFVYTKTIGEEKYQEQMKKEEEQRKREEKQRKIEEEQRKIEEKQRQREIWSNYLKNGKAVKLINNYIVIKEYTIVINNEYYIGLNTIDKLYIDYKEKNDYRREPFPLITRRYYFLIKYKENIDSIYTYIGKDVWVDYKITKEDGEKLAEINNLIKEKQKEENIITNKESNTIKRLLKEPEELKKYRELLNAGVITQEEFNVKKKELLNI